MNPIAQHIRDHLSATGKSMRALSLELGQGVKFVADIISGKSKRTAAAALPKLSAVIGVDLSALPVQRQVICCARARPPGGASRRSPFAVGAGMVCAGHQRRRTAAGDPRPVQGPRLAEQHHGRRPGNGYEHVRQLREPPPRSLRPCRCDDPVRRRSGTCPDAGATSTMRSRYPVQRTVRGPLPVLCSPGATASGSPSPASGPRHSPTTSPPGKVTMNESGHRDTAVEALSFWNRLADSETFRALGVRGVASPFADRRDRCGMPSFWRRCSRNSMSACFRDARLGRPLRRDAAVWWRP